MLSLHIKAILAAYLANFFLQTVLNNRIGLSALTFALLHTKSVAAVAYLVMGGVYSLVGGSRSEIFEIRTRFGVLLSLMAKRQI